MRFSGHSFWPGGGRDSGRRTAARQQAAGEGAEVFDIPSATNVRCCIKQNPGISSGVQKSGAPEEIRTPDLQVRSLHSKHSVVLYFFILF